jgi:glycosyltransferase involved in cell wall biosynthesis
MRVLHIAPSAFGTGGIYGGGERFPLELARAMAVHVDCEVVTCSPARTREPGGLRLRTRSLGRLHGIPPIRCHLAAAALGGADDPHAPPASTPGRIAAVTGRLLGRRLAVTDHGLPGGDWGGLLPRLFDRFLLVSAFSAAQLGVPRSRTRIIYGGADPLRFAPDPAVVRRGVLFMGRITPTRASTA